MKNYNLLDPRFLAQLVHAFAGSAITAILFIKIGLPFTYYALTIFLFIIFLKELLFDPKFEDKQPFLWEGVKDLFFYLPGIGITFLIIFL